MEERGSKSLENSVPDCNLSPVGRKKAIENSVSGYSLSTFVDSFNVIDSRQPGVSYVCTGSLDTTNVITLTHKKKTLQSSKAKYMYYMYADVL